MGGLVDRPLEDDATAVRACTRPDFDEVVGGPQDARVVVDDDNGIPIGEELTDDRQDAVNVGGVQADGRLVENVEDPSRLVAHGTGELHALALAVGQRRGCAVERQVGQAELHEAIHRLGHLLDDDAGHGSYLIRNEAGDALDPLAQFREGQARGLAQIHAVNQCGAHPLPQACAVAGRARAGDEVLVDAGEGLLVFRLRQGVFDRGDRVEVGEVQLRATGLGDDDDVTFLGGPLVDDRLLSIAQVPEGHIRAHAHFAGDVLHELPHEGPPRGNRALVNSEGFIGHEGRSVDDALDARPLAHRARAARVEGHFLRAETVEGFLTLRARERNPQGDVTRGRDAVPVRTQVGARAREQEAQMVEEFRRRAESGAHVGHAGALAQRERGGYVRHLVHRGLGCLGDTPARVGRQGLQVTP